MVALIPHHCWPRLPCPGRRVASHRLRPDLSAVTWVKIKIEPLSRHALYPLRTQVREQSASGIEVHTLGGQAAANGVGEGDALLMVGGARVEPGMTPKAVVKLVTARPRPLTMRFRRAVGAEATAAAAG